MLWTDIGGEENIKTKLKESVEWPLKFPEVSFKTFQKNFFIAFFFAICLGLH